LLAAGDDGALYGWDAASGAERFRRPVGGAIHRLALSPDRRRAAVASNNRVAVIELGDGALVATLDWHQVQVLGLAWAGDTLATGDVAGQVALWDSVALRGQP
jgi:WD40 repeat protein